MIQYRALSEHELCRGLFRDFIRHQVVTKCWRKEHNEWLIKDAPFIDNWTESDYDFLVSCLKHTLSAGGFVYAAFCGNALKGFVSVESGLFGGAQKYLDLTSLHVSEDMRGSASGRPFSVRQRTGQRKTGRKSCISPPIPPWKPRHFIKKWDVLTPKAISRNTLKQSLLTGSWNAGCRTQFLIGLIQIRFYFRCRRKRRNPIWHPF